uniref:Uncharacterized protein n=1 Tax=Parastrongyloides trichosuri TaxID=131310 RepID=A0A0N4Z9K7_PARTI
MVHLKIDMFEDGVVMNAYLMMRFYFNLNIFSIPGVLAGFIQSLKSLLEKDYFPNGDITKIDYNKHSVEMGNYCEFKKCLENSDIFPDSIISLEGNNFVNI